MTSFVFAYDVESAELAVPATKSIAAIHLREEVPATFFIVGKILEEHGKALREILDHPLFDIQTHTYSHRMLKDSGPHGPGVSLEEMAVEVGRGKELVEEVFERECIGCRPGCGFYRGFLGMPEKLAVFTKFGMKYISGWLRDEFDSIPANLEEPVWYTEDGFDDLLELPAHGWHDNILKGFGSNITLYPPRYEWSIPAETPSTVKALIDHEIKWVDQAIAEDKFFFSPVWHPWSLHRFDREMGMLTDMIKRTRERGMDYSTYTALWEKCASLRIES